jgi:hypothetical protein
MNAFFSDTEGRWINPEDEYIGNTGADLKTIIAALSNPTNETFDKIDQLLYDYFVLIRHGETTHTHKNVEWFLNESATGKVTISYKDGSTWADDCFSDELPMWLLLSILRAIQRRKPLGDQKADEVIKDVRDAEADFVQHRRVDSLKGVTLNVRPTFFGRP